MVNPVEHQLKITPTDDDRGFFIVSNKRTMFMDVQMLRDLKTAIDSVLQAYDAPDRILFPKVVWSNYEESKAPPIPYEVTGKARLEDLL